MNSEAQRINYNYLNIIKELPLLIKLRFKYKPTKIKNPKRVLIVDVCLIGDFIATVPALRQFIKKKKIKVDLVVSPPIEPLAKRIKGVNEVFSVRSIYKRNIEKIKNKESSLKDYDLVLVMRLSDEAYELIKKTKFKGIKSYLSPYLRYMCSLAKGVVNKGKVKQWRDANFEFIGEKKPKKVPFEDIFFFKKEDYNKIKSLFSRKDRTKKILIHAGSGWDVKLWGNANWIELLKQINQMGDFKFFFVGNTEKEKKDFVYIKERLNFKIYSLINKIDLRELMLIMKSCDYFFGVDSGPRIIADFVGLPSVSLLGPGPKYFMPTNNKSIIIDKSDCRCTNLFCYRKTSCVEKIKVKDVVKEFKKILHYSK